MKQFIKSIWFSCKLIKNPETLEIAYNIQNDPVFIKTKKSEVEEGKKESNRTEIINYLLSLTNSENYLEIGVRNPDDNFNKINCKNKYSVDPGVEFDKNPVDFKLTSDEFFKQLEENKLTIKNNIKFDVIFVDGLHISNQVELDISNSLKYLSENGFLILHDCNPPSEYHQREDYKFFNSPASVNWNGTTWKAFYKFRINKEYFSICFDTDFGVGVISKTKYPNFNNLEKLDNYFFEYNQLEKNRTEHLNLLSFGNWKKFLNNKE